MMQSAPHERQHSLHLHEPAIQEVKNQNGTVSHVVRWRQGGMYRKRSFADFERAQRLWLRLRESRRRPELRAELSGETPLWVFLEGTWTPWAEEHLNDRRRRDVGGHMRNHALPRLGHLPVIEITHVELDELKLDMARCGRSNETITKTLAALSNVLGLADDLDHIPDNPVLVRSPTVRPRTQAKITTLAEPPR
jgi:hypothetical protein